MKKLISLNYIIDDEVSEAMSNVLKQKTISSWDLIRESERITELVIKEDPSKRRIAQNIELYIKHSLSILTEEFEEMFYSLTPLSGDTYPVNSNVSTQRLNRSFICLNMTVLLKEFTTQINRIGNDYKSLIEELINV